MGGIRLHKEHCLNPSVNMCFWCGESKEIILFGASIKGEAPREVMTNYVPCDKCTENMALGVTLIEASDTPNENKEIQRGTYPTGRWWVIKREAAVKLFNRDDIEDKAFIEVGLAETIGLVEA